METDGRIFITISDKRGTNGQGQGTDTPPAREKVEKSTKDKLKDYISHQALNALQSSMLTAVNYSISNIGNFTGNYIEQQNVQIAMDLSRKLVAYGRSALAGTTITGTPFGALIGLGVQAGADVLNFALSEKTAYFNNARQNRTNEQLRALSGLNPLLDGSRGSER